MKARYIIDTVIIIDHLNGLASATRWLSKLKPGEAVISVITRAEVLVGAEPDDKPAIKLLLGQYPCLPLDAVTADKAAELRRDQRWKLPDAFQAALAQQHQLLLVTRNTKDFPPAQYEFVEVPYRL